VVGSTDAHAKFSEEEVMDPLTAVAFWSASFVGIAALVRAATWADSVSKSRNADESDHPPPTMWAGMER
jgi:hypothetical protein